MSIVTNFKRLGASRNRENPKSSRRASNEAGRYNRSPRSVALLSRVLPLILKEVESKEDSEFVKVDEKSSNSRDLVKLSTRSYVGGYLGNQTYRIAAGARTTVSTSGASVMQFGLPGGAILAASLSTTIVPEMAAFTVLFDECKVAGIRWVYNPTNPYNRGASQSYPIAFFWDEVDNFTPTNTNVGMGAQAQRAPLFIELSPDHSHSGTWMRPSNLEDMPWTPTSNLGSQTSTLGGFYVVGDGLNTASVIYGTLEYQFLIQFRARF